MYKPPGPFAYRAVTALAILLPAAAIAAVIIFAPQTEAPVAEPQPTVVVTEAPVEPEQPAEPAPEQTTQPDPEPTTDPEPSNVPELLFQQDEMNLMGSAIFDAFGGPVVILDLTGKQTTDANWNSRVVVPYDSTASIGDTKPLPFGGSSTWTLRVIESDTKSGTVYTVIG